MTAPAVPAVPARSTASRERPSLVPYILTELRNAVVRADTIVFIIIMPLAFYLMFGAMTAYGDYDAGRGNVNAVVMVNMAVFSTAMAATSVAGTSAIELAGGWGRQMTLTPGGMRSYVAVKTAAAVLLSLVPVTLIFTAGALLGARCDNLLVWVGSYLLCLTPTIPFSLYGLVIGLWFPSQGAVGIASASVSVWGFLSNIFMPLGGTLFTIAHATPLYGAAALTQRPILDDMVVTATGPIREGMWIQLANLVAWTLILALVCLASRRRSTVRR